MASDAPATLLQLQPTYFCVQYTFTVCSETSLCDGKPKAFALPMQRSAPCEQNVHHDTLPSACKKHSGILSRHSSKRIVYPGSNLLAGAHSMRMMQMQYLLGRLSQHPVLLASDEQHWRGNAVVGYMRGKIHGTEAVEAALVPVMRPHGLQVPLNQHLRPAADQQAMKHAVGPDLAAAEGRWYLPAADAAKHRFVHVFAHQLQSSADAWLRQL